VLIGFRENIDAGGPLDRAMIVIVGAIAEWGRSLIVKHMSQFACFFRLCR
jgi:hypothetical protein